MGKSTSRNNSLHNFLSFSTRSSSEMKLIITVDKMKKIEMNKPMLYCL